VGTDREYAVQFPWQGKTIKAPHGVTLAQAAALAGFPLNLVCGGRGTCGKCRVTIEKDGVKSQAAACQTLLEGPVSLLLQETDYLHQANILTAGFAGRSAEVRPALTKAYLAFKELAPEDGGGFTDWTDTYLRRKLGEILRRREETQGITLVRLKGELIDIQAGDRAALLYGAACDIGTTSVALYIYDLISGDLLLALSGLNRQISRGADVISRIAFAAAGQENLEALRDLVSQTINGLLEEAAAHLPDLRDNLYAFVACGNTAMQHLFFGYYPGNLGRSPFVSLSLKEQECRGEDTELELPRRCQVTFLPLLGGFIGGDITAALLTLGEDHKLRLLIDLGTNGEIVLGTKDRYLAASTACGPALEGGSIHCGMRGSRGAIEKVEISDGRVVCQVIGGGQATGICGSGIVDAAAVMLRQGLMEETGRILSRGEYEGLHPGSGLAGCLAFHGELPAFYLTPEIFLDQKDIRQIQLAKSAICAGCLALAANWGAALEEVEEFVLAGAFGNYIDKENALAIGLLPAVAPDKLIAIGNGAGLGAGMYLLDQCQEARARRLVANTRCCELAGDPVFTEEYLRRMNFSG
jgi:uncharacterized 2Fe-2S/4Fe-4S cluster protein (DUF4445 family)